MIQSERIANPQANSYLRDQGTRGGNGDGGGAQKSSK
jgi:hypothetical protein